MYAGSSPPTDAVKNDDVHSEPAVPENCTGMGEEPTLPEAQELAEVCMLQLC